MSRMLKILFCCLLIVPVIGNAAVIDGGLNFGGRTIGEKSIKDIYGSGTVIFPYLSINVFDKLYLGVAYEGGYSKDGKIGIYNDKTTLKMSGFEFFASYQFRIKSFAPYIKVGYASYKYEQTIKGSTVDFDIDKTKGTLTFGAGVKFFVSKGFFLCGDMRYVPLKVKPVNIEVDLGGLRYTFGIGYSFKM